MKTITNALVVSALLFSAATFANNDKADPLPQLGADSETVTVSGLSSGGAMAVQYSVAYSSEVKGVGVIAGIPYDCVNVLSFDPKDPLANLNSITRAFHCMEKGADVDSLLSLTKKREKDGKIDDITNIASQKVWLFSGTEDPTVKPVTMKAVNEYYEQVNTGDNINFVDTVPAGHAFVTDEFGSECNTTQSPYINNCNYDSAGEMLSWIVGPLKEKAPKKPGKLHVFDQRPFFTSSLTSMDDQGFVFVPDSCTTDSGCKVHVAFHGCQQNKDTIGDEYAKEVGINEWADANNIIVLYPQAKTRQLINPKGCWDWWGYTRYDYSFKSGPQMNAVNKMVKHLLQNPNAS
ncbi:PHB depolymerase family esterase [Grimontia sp. SpTr1]|uniref:extracellular catalytic domain type 2 short-chain-length polyhydroxyalkanoate depolymerase n=1 Tax=Grimontia sp. SpTr1 TaxID=2995319 RepID=UPI00248CDC93|nr:PHB depolymerase family esterase [Grimontia sp. SpTr1]